MAILHFSKEGDRIRPGEEPVIGEGIRGVALDRGPLGIWIPLVSTEQPGTGQLGRWLDDLPNDRRVVFPTVIHPRLVVALVNRRFRHKVFTGGVDGFVRDPWTL